jgi:hypothetical protein
MFKCKICGKIYQKGSKGVHLKTHGFTSKLYHDTFLKKKNDGICPVCGKETSWNSGSYYSTYCSIKCSKKVTEKARRKTMFSRYGVYNSFENGKIREKVKKTWNKKYGKDNPNKCKGVRDKIKATCLKKYGKSCSLQSSCEKVKRTMLKNYGVESPLQSKEIRNKIKKTCLSRYGVENPSQYYKVKKQKKETCFNNYGVDSPLKNKEIRDRVIRTNLERYGCENPSQNKGVHAKQFADRKKNNHGYLSNSEYLFSKKLKDTFYFKSEYFLNGHHFDFAIFKHGKLDVLVEIDGEFHHGLLSDCDGKFVGGIHDYLRFSLVPKGVKFLAIDSKKIKEGFKELRRIYQFTYKEFIKDMINSIPKSIPYYSFSKERMRKDYSMLCKYEYHKNSNLGRSIVLHYCRSLLNDIDWSERSSLIREHKIYYSPVSSHNPLDGLIEIKNISRLREKYRKKYKGKKEVRIKKHSPEKMLAICSLGKRYITPIIDDESKRIIRLLKLKAYALAFSKNCKTKKRKLNKKVNDENFRDLPFSSRGRKKYRKTSSIY